MVFIVLRFIKIYICETRRKPQSHHFFRMPNLYMNLLIININTLVL